MSIGTMLASTLGGLGLFLLGMRMMTDGLQMTAGQRIRAVLKTLSANRVFGCLTGATVTAIIQSSSATTVMLVGFVGAGLMTLYQAVGVILGANIGTTITAQLIAFKLSKLALPAIAIGVGFKFFAGKKKVRYLGEIILGFGLLFFGMTVMKDALAPFRTDPTFIGFFTRFDAGSLGGILLCVAVGTLLTIIVQSSSATIGLTMTLAWQGLLDYPAAMALVLGENIGTTITAQLSTLGSNNAETHQVANAHTLFNVIGVAIMVIIFPWFTQGVTAFTSFMGAGAVGAVVNGEHVNVGRYIANGHTLFNVVNALVFLAAMPWLVKITKMVSPKDEKEGLDIFAQPELGDRFQDNPTAAVAKGRSEVYRLSQVLCVGLSNALEAVKSGDLKKLRKWKRHEDHINIVHRELLKYFSYIYQSQISEDLASEISVLIRTSYNIERIGNAINNIIHHFEDIMEQDLPLSAQAWQEMEEISITVKQFLDMVSNAIIHEDSDLISKSEELEERIDLMREKMRQSHIERIRGELCEVDAGIMFMDIITRFEKVGDWTLNIAKGLSKVYKEESIQAE